MKKKRLDKKKRKRVRTRNWEEHGEDSFTHDRAKHRHAMTAISDAAPDLESLPTDVETNAIVISHAKKWAFVRMGDEERLCIVDERLKEEGATLVVPGDHVRVEIDGEGKEAQYIVRGVAPRKTKLSRPAGADARLKEQIFAANIDVLIIVAAAINPPIRIGLLDRYLIAAEMGGVEPVLCVNKMDLVSEEPAEIQHYRDLGVQVCFTSCETGEGIAALRKTLQGKLSILSGHSGVGKSTLLNVMAPELKLNTKTISEASQRGRHTTTSSRLYVLEDDIRIIDTPGIRALGLWGISAEEVAYFFPEIAELGLGCRFRNCTHIHEPHCAVLEALEAGRMHVARYESYSRIRASLESDTGTTPGRLAAKYQGDR
jgi:ribosome biogenesis GTPase